MTECCECERYARAFHGPHAYCDRCLRDAIAQDPDAHRCPTCGTEQPRGVLWERKAPCRECQQRGVKR
jgi:hypothetical protein